MGVVATTVVPFWCRIEVPHLGRSPTLALFAWLVMAVPSTALGDDVDMAWNACQLEGGSYRESFACDTDAGEHTIVASFALSSGLPGFFAIDGTVDVGTLGTNSILHDWWRITPGSCREGAIRVSLDFLDSPQTACLDPWSGQGIVSPLIVSVITTPDLPPHGSSTYERIRFTGYNLSGSVDLAPDTRYLAFKLIVRHTGTTGPGACEDCCSNASLVVSDLRVFSGTEERFLAGYGYPVEWQAPTGCRPVPVASRSWGQIRGLYR